MYTEHSVGLGFIKVNSGRIGKWIYRITVHCWLCSVCLPCRRVLFEIMIFGCSVFVLDSVVFLLYSVLLWNSMRFLMLVYYPCNIYNEFIIISVANKSVQCQRITSCLKWQVLFITLILLLRTLLKDWYCKFGFTRFTEWYWKPVSRKFMTNCYCRIKEKLLIGHRTWTEWKARNWISMWPRVSICSVFGRLLPILL